MAELNLFHNLASSALHYLYSTPVEKSDYRTQVGFRARTSFESKNKLIYIYIYVRNRHPTMSGYPPPPNQQRFAPPPPPPGQRPGGGFAPPPGGGGFAPPAPQAPGGFVPPPQQQQRGGFAPPPPPGQQQPQPLMQNGNMQHINQGMSNLSMQQPR